MSDATHASGAAAPADRPFLRKLSKRLGVLESYVDQTGGEIRYTSDATREHLVRAMGHACSTEREARTSLRLLARRKRARLIAPVRVVQQRSPRLRVMQVRMPQMPEGDVRWTLALRTEEGVETHWTGETSGGASRRLRLDIHATPPLGYHDLWVRFEGGDTRREAQQKLIVVPSRCTPPEVRLKGKRGFGLVTNLYTVKSRANWGAGDMGDVRAMAEWLGEHGGVFVGMNPLHALRNEGYDVSPYSPITRLFRNPIYIRVQDIPELRHNAVARERIASSEFQDALVSVKGTELVPYEAVMSLREPVLRALHRSFVEHEVRSHSPRARAYAEFVKEEDPQLTQFATFMVLSELHGPDARAWPEECRVAHGEHVALVKVEHAERMDYHRWLQFELDRQIAWTAFDAAKFGLSLGMYQDLAVGSAPSGSDVWSHPQLFRHGATVGAPPDMYSDEGQNWGLPAMDPHVLRESAYDYWIRLLRAGFRHTGALRIDHALGLFRMFWIPAGEGAREGAYVKSFTNDLLGILALESVRHNALVVGEDLGTVPADVPGVLAGWGVLSSKVLVFERDFHTGRFRDAKDYMRMALATVNTHDLPPLVGWMQERDINIRSEVGDLSDPAMAHSIRSIREHERNALVHSLVEAGLLPHDAYHHLESEDLIRAVHAFIRRTPSALVALSLDDLAHEVAPVNIPGVWQDKYPSWSRRMQHDLEDILASPRTRRALGTE